MTDERGAVIEDLAQKKHRINDAAHGHRELRDRMNDETRQHAQRRDGFNALVRDAVERANAHKAKRDELNAAVREGKIKRDALNAAARERLEALHASRRAQGTSGGVPLARLRADLKRLEFEQQTKVLSPQRERDLIETIAAKQKEILQREQAGEHDTEARAAHEALQRAKAEAEEAHRLVTELANQAQREHEAMVQLFGEADRTRKLADAAQADFVKSKTTADGVHREYVDMVSQVRDLERVMGTLRGIRRREEGPPAPPPAALAAAEEIFDRFRKGEKLSTEDLMELQRSGRLQ